MLSAFDDYPIHQTPEPIAQPASNDRNVYDRYWFNGFDRDAEFYFAIGMGRYPHLGILDGALSLVTADGVQHSFHVSGRAPADPSITTLGPWRLEVVEPMKVARLVIDDNDTGVTADLTFSAKTACVEEGRQVWKPGSRRTLDNTRFGQYGSWSGELTFDGQTIGIDAATTPGTKDRSWGIRPVGESDPAGAPPTEIPSFWFMWNPMHWDDHCSHAALFLDGDGMPWHTDASVIPTHPSLEAIPGITDPDEKRYDRIHHDITWRKGTRWAEHVELTMEAPDGSTKEIELDPVLRFQMKGIGYGHPDWGHGRWKGELAMTADSWNVDDLDPLAIENVHIQQLVKGRSDGHEGIGALEQIVIGPNRAGGFTDIVDGAA